MKILVAGSTGNTGTRLVNELCERGHQPVALVRESSDTGSLPDGAELRQGDLTDLDEHVTEGCEVVIFAAGSGGDTSAEMTDKLMTRVNSLAAGLIRPVLLIISHTLTGGFVRFQ